MIDLKIVDNAMVVSIKSIDPEKAGGECGGNFACVDEMVECGKIALDGTTSDFRGRGFVKGGAKFLEGTTGCYGFSGGGFTAGLDNGLVDGGVNIDFLGEFCARG